MKKLQKSNKKVIAGVCGGIAEYFNVDPTIVRLIMIIAIILGFGTGILIYLLAALIMPGAELSSDDLNNMKSANIHETPNKSEYKDNNKMHSDHDFNNFFN